MLRNIVQFVVLGALWGGSFLFLRITAPDLGPFIVTAIRTFLGAIVLGSYVIYTKQPVFKHISWGKMIGLALLSCGIPLGLFAFAEQYLTASLGAILNSTTVLYTLVLSMLLLGQTYNLKQYAGFLIGIVGVVVLIGWQPGEMNSAVIASIVAVLMATLCYSLGGIFTVTHFKHFPPIILAFWQQTFSAISFIPFAFADHPSQWPATTVILALICLGVFCTGIAFLLYFNIIKSMGISKAVTVAYLIPIFGMLWGGLFLKETITVTNLIGTAIILMGIFLTNIKNKPTEIKCGSIEKNNA